MRAGKLDQTITIRAVAYADDGFGGMTPTETDFATLRAQVIDESTDEFIRAAGASTERVRVFRVRHVDGVTLTMRVQHAGETFNIVQLKPIGRRRLLELRCRA